MSSQHIPAWQRIKIKQTQTDENKAEAGFDEEDPLNITTHLATGSLTRREKQRLIKGDQNASRVAKKKAKTTNRKKEKLAKDVRSEIKRKTVLKDQLRYLIDFYLEKSSERLPDAIQNSENVKTNYSEEKLHKAGSDGNSGVVDVWKFSKQKQNWLIKHFCDLEEIPVAYDDLIILYFKDLKGEGLKQSISERCRGKVKEWNDYVQLEMDKIKAIVDGKEMESEQSKEGDEEEKKTDKAKEVEQALQIPPNRDIAQRCLKLLEAWDSAAELQLLSI
ncbi:hypothetical protein HG536_0G03430 [Torulaspora globosa]|uniref:WKF domain-containing protein n=1 Tax=Torulaspora globosa TaxID=48254 RepID=A0A7G3ZLU5_9SACH|nr:uncharacterized protein HG536_0G03430 [Torulaspora globosa]QLL34481.1 hypothetical protein HG536_0G03430 [Torulaspora globosa]